MKIRPLTIIIALSLVSCSKIGYVELRVMNNCDHEVHHVNVDGYNFGDIISNGMTLYGDLKRPITEEPEISYSIKNKEYFFPGNSKADFLPQSRFILNIYCESDNSYWDIVDDN